MTDLATLYTTEHGKLIAYCRHFTRGDRDQAEDHAQDIWLRYMLAVARFDAPGYLPRKRLFGEAKRHLIDQYRADKRHPTVGQLGGEWDYSEWLGTEWPDVEGSIDAARLYEHHRVYLTREQCAALDLHLDGLSEEQAAKTLGVRPLAYRARLFRARQTLRRVLEQGAG